MRFAVSSDGVRLGARRGAKAFCPGCAQPVIAKCGDVKIAHWAHRFDQACDWEPGGETDWHLEWKNAAPPERQEVRIGRHRADIVSPAGVVVELQHSHLSRARIAERESEYKRMVWLFDAREARSADPKRLVFYTPPDRPKEDRYRAVKWNWAPSYTGQVRKPLFVDLGGGELLWVGRWHSTSMNEDGLHGGGWTVPADWFRREVINGRGIPRAPRGLQPLTDAWLNRPAELEPDEPPPSLDWRHHRVGASRPCRICGEGAIMRDADGAPCHKVCAELEAQDQRASGSAETGAA